MSLDQSLAHLALAVTNDLPIRHQGQVHNGKVRSVYWLTLEDSARLIKERSYACHSGAGLGVMVTSDRISAFDCNWHSQHGLNGIPGKGASLNAISKFWFDQFDGRDIGFHHLLDVPHPLVWIVQKADPILVECVVRRYMTGSMWREYQKGEREFGGRTLKNGLKQYARLDSLVFTPTTKGTMSLSGIKQQEDAPITVDQIKEHFSAFGLKSADDIRYIESMSFDAFSSLERGYASLGYLCADTKFECGYIINQEGRSILMFIDEAGTPDSSRMWPEKDFKAGFVKDASKEYFRQYLMQALELDLLTNKDRLAELKQAASSFTVPKKVFDKVSMIYRGLAKNIIGTPISETPDARIEIVKSLETYGLIEKIV